MSQETRAYNKMLNRIKNMSDESLKTVYNSAISSYAKPENGWGTFIDNSWIVFDWDIWMDSLYSEMTSRNLIT